MAYSNAVFFRDGTSGTDHIVDELYQVLREDVIESSLAAGVIPAK
jgi:hypothetical protein